MMDNQEKTPQPPMEARPSNSHLVKNIVIGVLAFIVIVETVLLLFGGEAGAQEAAMRGAPETPAGIDATSAEYEDYASCMSQCSVCEATCESELRTSKAVQALDTALCEPLSGSMLQECKGNVYYHLAQANRDTSLCDKLPEARRNSCYYAVVVASGDSSQCAILPEDSQQDCKEAITDASASG
jgi:hypothetical protein